MLVREAYGCVRLKNLPKKAPNPSCAFVFAGLSAAWSPAFQGSSEYGFEFSIWRLQYGFGSDVLEQFLEE